MIQRLSQACDICRGRSSEDHTLIAEIRFIVWEKGEMAPTRGSLPCHIGHTLRYEAPWLDRADRRPVRVFISNPPYLQ